MDIHWSPSPGPSTKRKASPLPNPPKKKRPSILRPAQPDTSQVEMTLPENTRSATLSGGEDDHPKMQGIELSTANALDNDTDAFHESAAPTLDDEM